MKKICVLSDFDGTITVADSLYTFFKTYATEEWKEVERLWIENKINSQECLIREFGLVSNLSKELADKFLKTVKIDKYFKNFHQYCKNNDIDFIIVSDGVDYFIDGILKNNEISGINVVSNHGEFNNDKIELSFPNKSDKCLLHAGTCKCNVAKTIKKDYEKIIYIGDGVSDFCVSDKADILFAKSKLAVYCEMKNINYIKYEDFNDIMHKLQDLKIF